MASKTLLYQTRGRAAEFCPLAINHLIGDCPHGCKYCWVTLNFRRGTPYGYPLRPRDVINDANLEKDLTKARDAGWTGTVLMNFLSDPYPKDESCLFATTRVIMALQAHGFAVTILTKAGKIARRDFDILRPGIDTFATTLTCIDKETSLLWEPGAGLPDERIENLKIAHEMGLKTWVSCEPPIQATSTISLVQATKNYADHFKFGTMNYHEYGKSFDWRKFALGIVGIQPEIGKPFCLKQDLAKYLGRESAFWIGGRG